MSSLRDAHRSRMPMRREDVRTERDIREYLAGWSEFERDVYVAASKIPEGKVTTYGRLAKAAGRPGAARAVANAMHDNPLYPLVPCHRVVKADGGFGGDPKRAGARRRHVVDEGVPVKDGKVVMTDDVLY